MLELVDGPCKGNYMVKRAPVFLRAVLDKAGEKDVLDLVEDTPKDSETVYIYQREGSAGQVHINAAKVKGFYAMAKYHYLPNVDGETLRDNPSWQAWATAHLQSNEK
jgi:hypothetical protein